VSGKDFGGLREGEGGDINCREVRRDWEGSREGARETSGGPEGWVDGWSCGFCECGMRVGGRDERREGWMGREKEREREGGREGGRERERGREEETYTSRNT